MCVSSATSSRSWTTSWASWQNSSVNERCCLLLHLLAHGLLLEHLRRRVARINVVVFCNIFFSLIRFLSFLAKKLSHSTLSYSITFSCWECSTLWWPVFCCCSLNSGFLGQFCCFASHTAFRGDSYRWHKCWCCHLEGQICGLVGAISNASAPQKSLGGALENLHTR